MGCGGKTIFYLQGAVQTTTSAIQMTFYLQGAVRTTGGMQMTFYPQDDTQFIVSLPAAASGIEQTDEVKDFKEFMKTFAHVVNE